MVIIPKFDSPDAPLIRSMLEGMCLDGSCYEFAIAIHRGTGLPLVGLWSNTASGDNGVPGTWRHAAVRLPNGDYFDARGLVTPWAFGTPFGEPEPWDIRDITEADLTAVRPIPEHSFETIAKLAQSVWPDLPWLPGTPHNRMLAFLKDLEALSVRHGVWIRSPYPAARPVLAEHDKTDNLVYRAEITADGLAISFDREFK
jgi:hypothetical protein